MKENLKYDPEDLESLLLHKNFHELYPEEKEFVLRHMEGPGEYESMRKTLLDVIESSRNEPWLEPDASIKANLMKHYASEEQRGFTIWLNTLFAQVAEWFKPQPALRYAIAGLAVVGVVVSIWLVSKPQQEELLAENITNPANQSETSESGAGETQLQASQSENVKLAEEVADLIAEAPMPPAPVSMDMVSENLTEEVNEAETAVIREPSMAQSGQSADAEDMPMSDNEEKVLTEPATVKDQETITFSDNVVQNSSVETLSEIKTVEITSKSKRSRSVSEKAKWSQEKNSGAPIAEWDELFSLLYTAP
ncbi:MAG: hypothetical protein RL220_506 [Bacteroidota bacterium]